MLGRVQIAPHIVRNVFEVLVLDVKTCLCCCEYYLGRVLSMCVKSPRFG